MGSINRFLFIHLLTNISLTSSSEAVNAWTLWLRKQSSSSSVPFRQFLTFCVKVVSNPLCSSQRKHFANEILQYSDYVLLSKKLSQNQVSKIDNFLYSLMVLRFDQTQPEFQPSSLYAATAKIQLYEGPNGVTFKRAPSQGWPLMLAFGQKLSPGYHPECLPDCDLSVWVGLPTVQLHSAMEYPRLRIPRNLGEI